MVFSAELALGARPVGLPRCKTNVCNDMRPQKAVMDNWLLV